MTTFNPDEWTTSFFRALRTYVETRLPFTGDPAVDVYELEMSYPDPINLTKRMPFPMTIIHFEIDDITPVPFGLGDNVVSATYDAVGHTVEEWEAHCHRVTLDVGVWASVESGGVTARLEARQDLDRLFLGPAAQADCMTITDGLDILSFIGGRFITDTINDLPVFRVVDQELRIRVYSRLKKVPVTAIEDIGQDQGLTISDQVIIG